MVLVVVSDDATTREVNRLFSLGRCADHVDAPIFEFPILEVNFVNILMIDIVA